MTDVIKLIEKRFPSQGAILRELRRSTKELKKLNPELVKVINGLNGERESAE